jgi:hypothetical protein
MIDLGSFFPPPHLILAEFSITLNAFHMSTVTVNTLVFLRNIRHGAGGVTQWYRAYLVCMRSYIQSTAPQKKKKYFSWF